jgi:hypothetical protein
VWEIVLTTRKKNLPRPLGRRRFGRPRADKPATCLAVNCWPWGSVAPPSARASRPGRWRCATPASTPSPRRERIQSPWPPPRSWPAAPTRSSATPRPRTCGDSFATGSHPRTSPSGGVLDGAVPGAPDRAPRRPQRTGSPSGPTARARGAGGGDHGRDSDPLRGAAQLGVRAASATFRMRCAPSRAETAPAAPPSRAETAPAARPRPLMPADAR